MKKSKLILIPFALALFLSLPSISSAADRYVATTGDDTANDCLVEASPCVGITYAVNQTVAGDTLHIADGTYIQQVYVDNKSLDIAGGGVGETVIKPPPGGLYKANDIGGWALMKIWNGSTGSVSNLTLEGPGESCGSPGTLGSPYMLDYGFLIEGSTTYWNMTNVEALSIRDTPLSSCQHGGGARYRAGSHGTVNGFTASDYQKSGFIASAAGTEVSASNLDITGTVDAPLAQLGMQISSGAKAYIDAAYVKDNICQHVNCGPDAWTKATSLGLLNFGAAEVTVRNSSFRNNDVGIYDYNTGLGEIKYTDISANKFTGLAIDSSSSAMKIHDNSMDDQPMGLYVLSYSGQPQQTSQSVYTNDIRNNDEGVVYANDNVVYSTALIESNSIVGNTVGANTRWGDGVIHLENNWWGCNDGPGASGCDTVSGFSNTDPRAMITIDMTSPVLGGSTHTATVSAQKNSAGDTLVHNIPYTPVDFTAFHATMNPSNITLAEGIAQSDATFSNNFNTASVSGTMDNQTVTINIGVNLPPVNTVVPSISQNGNDYQVDSDGTWTGDPTIVYTYQWLECDFSGLNCNPIAGETGSTLTEGALTPSWDGQVRLRVTGTNDYGNSSALSNGIDYILPPHNTVPPTIASNGDNADFVDGGSWVGTPVIDYTYQWYSCDNDGNNCSPITGETNQNLLRSALPDEFNGKVKIEVIGTNAGGSGSGFSNLVQFSPIGLAPYNIVKPTISETGSGFSLFDMGLWGGTLPIDYSYQWNACDTSGDNCSPISGATSDSVSYEYLIDQLGQDWTGSIRVTVKATNDYGNAEALSGYLGVNSLPCAGTSCAPKNVVPPTVTKNGKTYTVTSPGEWSGQQPIEFSYSWYACDKQGKNCALIEGETGKSFDSSVLGKDFDGVVKAEVTGTNNYGQAEIKAKAKNVPNFYKLINTRRASIAPAVNGWAVFSQPGDWKGRGRIRLQREWQLCSSNGCHKLATKKTVLRIRRSWRGRSVRLKVVASNRDGRVVSISKRHRINRRGFAVSNGMRCRPTSNRFKFRIGTPGKPISSARVKFGSTIVSPVRRTKYFYYYNFRMPKTYNTRRVVRATWQVESQDRLQTRTSAYLTCR